MMTDGSCPMCRGDVENRPCGYCGAALTAEEALERLAVDYEEVLADRERLLAVEKRLYERIRMVTDRGVIEGLVTLLNEEDRKVFQPHEFVRAKSDCHHPGAVSDRCVTCGCRCDVWLHDNWDLHGQKSDR